MSDDPERYSIDFRGVPRVPVATVKAWHRLKTTELNRLKAALEAELAARALDVNERKAGRAATYKPGYPVDGVNATPSETEALRAEYARIEASTIVSEGNHVRIGVGGSGGGVSANSAASGGLPQTMGASDTQTGLDRAPTRYTAQGRETIDRMRDFCWYEAAKLHLAEEAVSYSPSARYFVPKGSWASEEEREDSIARLADLLFLAHCRLTAMKYRDRTGLKEGETIERNEKAAYFYETMAAYVESGGQVPDPRHQRPDFQPYVRQNWKDE